MNKGEVCDLYTYTYGTHTFIQMKPAYRLSWMMEFRLLKIVSVGVEAGILFTHQFTDSLYKEHPGLWQTPLLP
jgi:hypothetical protein